MLIYSEAMRQAVHHVHLNRCEESATLDLLENPKARTLGFICQGCGEYWEAPVTKLKYNFRGEAHDLGKPINDFGASSLHSGYGVLLYVLRKRRGFLNGAELSTIVATLRGRQHLVGILNRKDKVLTSTLLSRRRPI